MNTEIDPEVSCYLCSGKLRRSEASNYKGHHAHPHCVDAANFTPFGPASCQYKGCYLREGHAGPHEGADRAKWGTPAVPRVWDSPTHDPTNLFPAAGAAVDHAFSGEDKSVTGVMCHFSPQLLEGPDAHTIIAECHAICELLLTKNRAYGSSFKTPLHVFSKLSPVEAINARMDDKLARMKQAKDFSEDTEADLIGYLILKRIALRLEREKMDLCPSTGMPLEENPDYAKAEGHFPGLDALHQMKKDLARLDPLALERKFAQAEAALEAAGKIGKSGQEVCCGTAMKIAHVAGTKFWKCLQCGSTLLYATSPPAYAIPAPGSGAPCGSGHSEHLASSPPVSQDHPGTSAP